MASEYTPQYLEANIIQELIDQLITPEYNSKIYNLDSPRHYEHKFINGVKEPEEPTELKPAGKKLKSASRNSKTAQKLKSAFKPPTISEGITKRTKLLGEIYVAGILNKLGCVVSIMQKGFGYNLLVLSADNTKTTRLNVVVDRGQHSPYIRIETYRIINGEVITDINSDYADYYMIIICGMRGVYQISTKKIRQLIKDHSQKELTAQCDNGYYELNVIDRQLLLANSTLIKL